MTAFLDTNVLLYADDLGAGPRLDIARDLVRRSVVGRTGVVSTQVLQEYYVNARKKLGMDGGAARARVELYGALDVVTADVDLVLRAVDLNRLDTISFWDALVVTAASTAGCDVLYSEDLQHGRLYGAVKVVNPFV